MFLGYVVCQIFFKLLQISKKKKKRVQDIY